MKNHFNPTSTTHMRRSEQLYGSTHFKTIQNCQDRLAVLLCHRPSLYKSSKTTPEISVNLLPSRKLEKLLQQLALLCMVGLAQTLISQAQNTPRDFLQLHNAARREVGVGPLKWDLTLEAYAKDYAKQRSGDCELVHSGGPYGENIYWGYGEGYTGAKAVMKFWLDERQFYDYDSNSCMFGKECLHYTQIVWRNSKRLGCASAACPDERVFFTCNYDPPGNIYGE